ncbi:MAG: hypothetical protein ACRD0W_00485 [Acidimicrobiales bacterium]
MSVVSGDIVLHVGKEVVVVDLSLFDGDHTLDRAVLRPKDDPDGEFDFAHPDELQVIGHIQPYGDWTEQPRGSGNWVRT